MYIRPMLFIKESRAPQIAASPHYGQGVGCEILDPLRGLSMRASNYFLASALVRVPVDLAADDPQGEAIRMLYEALADGLDRMAVENRLPRTWLDAKFEFDPEHGVIELIRG